MDIIKNYTYFNFVFVPNKLRGDNDGKFANYKPNANSNAIDIYL